MKRTSNVKISRAGTSVKHSQRMKCACANCQCTVSADTAIRKGNLLYCSRRCLTECTLEQCMCEHDGCAV